MTLLVKTVARNSIITFISKLGVKLLSFGFTIFIARLLGEAEFGRYALIWSYVTIFATASDLGLGMYIIREIAKDKSNNFTLAGNVMVFRLGLAAVTLLLIGLSALFIGYSIELIKHICLAGTILFLYAVQDPLDSILQAKERVDISSGLRIIGQLVFVSLGFTFLWLGWGITGLIIATLGNITITSILAWILIQRYWGGIGWRLQPALWPKLLVVALPFAVIGFALNWSQKIDTVILSLYWPEEVLGWYNAAYNLILGLIIISNSFNVAFYPSLSKEFALDNLTLQRIYKQIFKFLFMASLPLTIGLFILSQPIILTLYGPAYTSAILPLSILAWILPFIFISEFLRYTALVIGQEKKAALGIAIAALINIVLNFVFIPQYGLVAATLTTVFTEILLVIIYTWQLRANFSLLMIGKTFWRPAVASVAMLSILLIIYHISYSIPLIVTIISGGVIYIGSLYLLGSLGPEEITIIRKMLAKASTNITSSSSVYQDLRN